MSKFKVLYIVKPEYAAGYPERYRIDSAESPDMVDYLEDESELFVLNCDTNEFHRADEFFSTLLIDNFDATELPPFEWPDK